jgi:hypothetical protein
MSSYGSRRRKQRRRTRIALGAVLVMALVAAGLLIYDALNPHPGLAMPDLGNLHIPYPQTATYNSSPPTSGPHYTFLARWGIHTEPIANELQVHNLEDGGVMVQYNCPEACPDLVAQLTRVVERYDTQVILAPYPDMEARIALTAWQRIDTFETFDEDRIVAFIEAYRGIDHHE